MSVSNIRRRTAEKLRHAPVDDLQALEESLRCDTPNCPNRWVSWFSRGKRCSPCDERLARAEQARTRPMFPAAGAPPAAQPAAPAAIDDDAEPLPF